MYFSFLHIGWEVLKLAFIKFISISLFPPKSNLKGRKLYFQEETNFKSFCPHIRLFSLTVMFCNGLKTGLFVSVWFKVFGAHLNRILTEKKNFERNCHGRFMFCGVRAMIQSQL